MKTTSKPPKPKSPQPPADGRQGNAAGGLETYPAPAPSAKGRIIGLDCHPDTFTWAVLCGTSLHDARQLESHADRPLTAFLDWAATQGTPDDLFLMEAGSNSFEICHRLHALGRRSCVLESAHVGRHAALHCDNDKIAAVRIAKVYLIGNAPCVICGCSWFNHRGCRFSKIRSGFHYVPQTFVRSMKIRGFPLLQSGLI